MSNQVLASQRFRAKSRKAVTRNSLFQYQIREHDQAIVRRARSVNIDGAALGSTIIVEPSLVDLCENMRLKCTVANSADSGAAWGMNLIKSVVVRSGSEQLMNYPDYRTYLRWALSFCDAEKKARIVATCFGTAATNGDVIIPLPYPGSYMTKKNWNPAAATPLSLGSLATTRPLTYEITFNTAAAVDSAMTISKTTLQYDELITNNPEQYRRPFSVSQLDMKQSIPVTVTTAKKTHDGLEALQGSVAYYWADVIPTADINKGGNSNEVSECTQMKVICDGVDYDEFTSAQENNFNSILRGDDSAAAENRIYFTRHPAENDYVEAIAHTSGFKRISCETTSAAGQVTLCPILHRTFFSSGRNMAVRES